MEPELIFRVLLLILLVGFVLHRGIQTQRHGPQVAQIDRTLDIGANQKLVSLFAVIALIASPAYIFFPNLVSLASLPIPVWLRYSGILVVLVGFVLLEWAQSSLSTNWSDTPVKLKRHTLTTTGPYRWVRHPIYTAFLLILIAPLLLSANWLVGISWIAMTYLEVSARIPVEEAMLRESFGKEYTAYAKRSGRLLPRLGR